MFLRNIFDQLTSFYENHVEYNLHQIQSFILQILPGSHKCGRIEHQPIDGQFGADMSRINDIKQNCPLMYVELNPGKSRGEKNPIRE